MRVWIDAQVSPALAVWMRERFAVEASAVRDLGLVQAEDQGIFAAARAAGAVVLTKDADFVELLERLGPPPRVVWLRCGNTSNARLRTILERWWPKVEELLAAGEKLIEIAEGGAETGGRVAPGRLLPGAPTDPDVRDSRIRLFETRVRYAGRAAAGVSSG